MKRSMEGFCFYSHLRYSRNTESEIDQLLTEITVNALWREPALKGNAPDPGDDHLWALLDCEPNTILVTPAAFYKIDPPVP